MSERVDGLLGRERELCACRAWARPAVAGDERAQPVERAKRVSAQSGRITERLGLGRWVLCTATETRQCDICTNRLLRGGAQARRLRPPSIVCLECAKDDSLPVDWHAPRKITDPAAAIERRKQYDRAYQARRRAAKAAAGRAT